MTRSFIKERAAPLFIIAVLAIVAYLPTLTQPFISDDYPGIKRSLSYASSGWEALAKDPVERPLATTFSFSYAIYHLFVLLLSSFRDASGRFLFRNHPPSHLKLLVAVRGGPLAGGRLQGELLGGRVLRRL